MSSIQSCPHPLVFPLGNAAALGFTAPASEEVAVRTSTRALEGMQKEAIVACGSQGTAWRMVSDEGPYLNGTDLAPFPLAFFTAGLAACHASAILAALRRRGSTGAGLKLVQDNRYTMQGSALRGTMIGGALPVELAVQLDGDVDAATLQALAAEALDACPPSGLLREALPSEFSLTVNGARTATGRVAALAGEPPGAPEGFDAAAPAAQLDFPADIIHKTESARAVTGVAGGSGTSLAAEQDRTLHVRGACTVRPDGLREIEVRLLKPIGSVFRFLAAADDDGEERAPPGLAYLSAGIAFCYMTQLGRYAHIVRKPLAGYRIVQDTLFSRPGAPAAAQPVRTHVFLETPDGADYGRTLVDMGEQTCFLHAACRSVVPTELRVVAAA